MCPHGVGIVSNPPSLTDPARHIEGARSFQLILDLIDLVPDVDVHSIRFLSFVSLLRKVLQALKVVY